MDALVSIWLAGGAQGMLLCAVILAFSSSNPAANRWLALFVGLRSLHLLMLWATYGGFEDTHGLLRGPLLLMSVLAPAALYLYVRTLTDGGLRRDPRLPLHLLVLAPPLLWYFHHAGSAPWSTAGAAEIHSWPSTAFVSMWVCFVTIPYCALALRLLDAHGRRLERALSTIEQVTSLRWLRWLVTGLIASHCLLLSLDFLQVAGLIGPRPTMLTNLAITLLSLYVISIGGLRQPQVFARSVQQALSAIDTAEPAAAEDAGEEAEAGRAKYARSNLDDERRGVLWQRLQRLLAEAEPYLNPDLNLPELARLLGVRPQELSEVINSQHQGSFYDLINRHRVQAAIRLLDEDGGRQRKIMDIGLSAGFRNQSTFYQHFRRVTAMTPAAYRDQLKRAALGESSPAI